MFLHSLSLVQHSSLLYFSHRQTLSLFSPSFPFSSHLFLSILVTGKLRHIFLLHFLSVVQHSSVCFSPVLVTLILRHICFLLFLSFSTTFTSPSLSVVVLSTLVQHSSRILFVKRLHIFPLLPFILVQAQSVLSLSV